MRLEREVRIDKKGREYSFVKSVKRSEHDHNNFVSATIFPNPNSKTWAVYIWWEKRTWIVPNTVDLESSDRWKVQRWCKRYLVGIKETVSTWTSDGSPNRYVYQAPIYYNMPMTVVRTMDHVFSMVTQNMDRWSSDNYDYGWCMGYEEAE